MREGENAYPILCQLRVCPGQFSRLADRSQPILQGISYSSPVPERSSRDRFWPVIHRRSLSTLQGNTRCQGRPERVTVPAGPIRCYIRCCTNGTHSNCEGKRNAYPILCQLCVCPVFQLSRGWQPACSTVHLRSLSTPQGNNASAPPSRDETSGRRFFCRGVTGLVTPLLGIDRRDRRIDCHFLRIDRRARPVVARVPSARVLRGPGEAPARPQGHPGLPGAANRPPPPSPAPHGSPQVSAGPRPAWRARALPPRDRPHGRPLRRCDAAAPRRHRRRAPMTGSTACLHLQRQPVADSSLSVMAVAHDREHRDSSPQ